MIGFRSMLGGAVAAALVAGLAGPAGARSLKTVEGWEINATPKTCSMASTFSDDVTIGLIWAPSTGELGFMAGLPHSYGVGGQKTAPVSISFDGEGPYTLWEDQSAAVINGADSTGVIANWGAQHADDLAKAVAASTHVRVRVGDRDLGSYALAGSPAAYQALMRCGRLLAGK
jgi:hypothetical protein